MIYVSIDLETTGLDPNKDQVLMVAAVVEDSTKNVPVEELPYFECLVRHDRYEGDAFALALNRDILSTLGKRELPAVYRGREVNVFNVETWQPLLRGFLERTALQLGFEGPLVAAGKQVGAFDLKFLSPELRKRFHHRTIDPGSVFVDWDAPCPHGLEKLKKLLGVPGDVTHDALEDARDVIRCLRKGYNAPPF